MADEWATRKIEAWVEEGAMTPASIMARLDRRIEEGYAIGDEEEPILDAIFRLKGSSEDYTLPAVTESHLLHMLETKTELPRSIESRKSCKIIYDSIARLSSLPFLSKWKSKPAGAFSQASQGLTRKKLVRGLVWTLPDRPQHFIEEGSHSRYRTEEDHHRLIFQSLATGIPRQGTHAPASVSSSSENNNDDDEIYTELLDVLYSTQTVVNPGLARVHRDTMWPLAKRIATENGIPTINGLAIPIDRFERLPSTTQPKNDEASIQTDENPHNALQERCVLFQLQPVQSVFKGVVGTPGWSLDDDQEGVRFGLEGGVSLMLRDGLRRAVVRQKSCDEESSPNAMSYAPRAWQGDWTVDLDVKGIEIWSEQY
ncbi:hypothetical protein F4808DRAFT_476392 [Astrocystis sublimbata]|nr:hypothetical protein F4808DRAFT_476392 [Astrocystis sublimbata]